MSNVWLYEKTFWKLLNDIARDDEIEEIKYYLSHVRGFEDVEQVIWKKLDRKSMKEITKILFNYTGNEQWNAEQSR